ncbi:DUF1559 domain-containing protein [uncultured Gimesia sp.]|uniref:DUF1559 family PulG-like putative transporter n=1 Tax=uncultured Gimesia sp. TaxID=1678688 RepID=UPI002617E2A2|nr:DUF1559 domain-containing protein [uncultured Gimesia sp.]
MNEPSPPVTTDTKGQPSMRSRIVENSPVLLSIVLFVAFAVFLRSLSTSKDLNIHSLNNLRNIGLATINYSSGALSNLPMGGTTDQQGNPQHGWVTAILPYLNQVELSKQINHKKPWNDPENETVFKTSLPSFLNPGIQGQTFNSKGYALSHYTANSRVMGLNNNSSLSGISLADGMTYTILLGEINANFPAWGSATNMRDPAKGLNGGPDSFGSPSANGVVVIFADGSGKLLNKNIDPKVLKALSTPNGGETISPNDF